MDSLAQSGKNYLPLSTCKMTLQSAWSGGQTMSEVRHTDCGVITTTNPQFRRRTALLCPLCPIT